MFVTLPLNYSWIAFMLLIFSLYVYLSRWQKALHVTYKNILILEGLAKSNSGKPNAAF